MRIILAFSAFFLCLALNSAAQTITLNEGFEEVILGISQDNLIEIIGFKGKTVDQQDYITTYLGNRDQSAVPAFRTGFDQCVVYNHIMPIPVTKVFFSNDQAVTIVISSFPSFSRPICLETQTKEGLTFWDTKQEMERIYGSEYRIDDSDGRLTYYYYDQQGIGFGLSNKEIRIIEFYKKP